jgi:threonine dehydrogenase-like Zn-dependent dehydrogenase
MKAAFIERHGGPEVFQNGDLPDPVAGPGEAVIDIVAASVNAADWKVRSGLYQQTRFPVIPGRDFSGVISAVGEGVADLTVGDEVFGVCASGQEGAYAEKVAVKAVILAKKPDGLSHIHAAALALTGLTALSAVEETLQLHCGETILIQGGAGGVAGFAIQLAKQIGARVITTASAANRDYVRSLGADEIIDYNAEDFTQVSGCERGARHGGGRCDPEVLRRTQAGRPCCVHCIRRGAPSTSSPRRRNVAAPPGYAGAPAARAHRQAVPQWCCTRPRDHALSAGRGYRRPPIKRITPFPGQAGVCGAVIDCVSQTIVRGWPERT